VAGQRRERMCGGAKIASGCDLVLLSKFGTLETMRAGLAAAFEAAIAAHKPVLTTVSDRHRDPWQTLTPEAVAASRRGGHTGLVDRHSRTAA
jgi:nucleoside-triphosphatase THEP1